MTEVWWLYVLIFFCVNLVLMNLFIALMSSKFTECMRMADRTFTIERYEVAREFQAVSLSLVGPIVALPAFILDLIFFCWHYSALQILYPACALRELLWLHVCRSNAHQNDLDFSMLEGVKYRQVPTGDVDEVQKLHSFLENARRHFMRTHFPGQQYVKLAAIGELELLDNSPTVNLEVRNRVKRSIENRADVYQLSLNYAAAQDGEGMGGVDRLYGIHAAQPRRYLHQRRQDPPGRGRHKHQQGSPLRSRQRRSGGRRRRRGP